MRSPAAGAAPSPSDMGAATSAGAEARASGTTTQKVLPRPGSLVSVM